MSYTVCHTVVNVKSFLLEAAGKRKKPVSPCEGDTARRGCGKLPFEKRSGRAISIVA
jgi:hypothetical protein